MYYGFNKLKLKLNKKPHTHTHTLTINNYYVIGNVSGSSSLGQK